MLCPQPWALPAKCKEPRVGELSPHGPPEEASRDWEPMGRSHTGLASSQ